VRAGVAAIVVILAALAPWIRAEEEAAGELSDPEIVRTVAPAMTDRMIFRKEPGTVLLQCTIDVCGRVRDCKVLKSNGADFSTSAIAAAEKRLYRPAMKNGKPVAIRFTIRLDFQM
jgi:TonB family protein